MGILLIILIHISNANEPLPVEVRDQYQNLSKQFLCEENWPEWAENSLEKKVLQPGWELWISPCSAWAHNRESLLFLVQTDPGSETITKITPLSLPIHRYGQQIVNDFLLPNVLSRTNPETGEFELAARFYLNGWAHCGVIAKYIWKPHQKKFSPTLIRWNDDCKRPENWQAHPLPDDEPKSNREITKWS